MRIIPYIAYLLLVGMHIVIWRDITSVFGVVINLPVFLVLAVALYKDEVTATWFGFLVGLVLAAGSPVNMGWHSLAMAGVGLSACHVRERINLDSMWAKLLLVAGGVLAHNILSMLINRSGDFVLLFVSSALTGTVYTVILAWLFFLFKESVITVQKIRSMF